MNAAQPIDTPKNDNNQSILKKLDWMVSNRYLSLLSEADVYKYEDYIKLKASDSCFRLFPIKRIVYDRTENSLGKLSSMYIGTASAEISPILLIEHKKGGGRANFFFGALEEGDYLRASAKTNILRRNLLANFPGCQTDVKKGQVQLIKEEDQEKLLNSCFSSEYRVISCVSGIASSRSDIKKENASFIQGIERVIDAMEDQAYSIILIAHNLSNDDISGMQAKYENTYNIIYPYLKTTYSLNQSGAMSVAENISHSLSDMFSISVSNTVGKTDTISAGHTSGEHVDDSIQKGINAGASLGVNAGINYGISAGINAAVVSGGMYVGNSLGIEAGVNISTSKSHSETRGTNWSDTFTKGLSSSETQGETNTNGKTTTIVKGSSESYTITEGQTVQVFRENKIVQGILNALEQKIKRLREGKSLGMFAVAAYFLAKDPENAKAASSIYKATITGNNTFFEDATINIWKDSDPDFSKIKELFTYLRHGQHPLFIIDGMLLTPASVVTSSELAIQLGLPKKSVTGLPVSESVSFGRNITLIDGKGVFDISSKKSGEETIEFGKLYHLGNNGNTNVLLDVQSLTMHTFVTGTTGSGKSNTLYKILQELVKLKSEREVHFLVIEPAKGEYKSILGDCDMNNPRVEGRPVAVYGTNPKSTPLLRINPFSFEKDIHVLEHIDRLVSIFNVCWPMEAAMPAILKQAVERAYVKAGWNLKKSINKYDTNLFPSFFDVMTEVNTILDESDYSGDNKGDYKGALCTRLRELTTGLNSMIFCSNELSNKMLFDTDVIVDLSRLGSTETKSLIMGLLVIRLQEYRQSTTKKMNAPLKHVTVLEEAHHLLKRTSTEQNTQNANLLGKSVEMISNSLAELRSFGEGIIIADQSPAQIDLSAIRNTNTKIVMRLPMYEDRKTIGKAIGLNDIQIDELAKLPTGIAAVYQNNWLDAVLVNIDLFSGKEKTYSKPDNVLDTDDVSMVLELVLSKEKRKELLSMIKGDGRISIGQLNIPVTCKQLLLSLKDISDISDYNLSEIVFILLCITEIMEKFQAENEDNQISDEKLSKMWLEYLEMHIGDRIYYLNNEEKRELYKNFTLRGASNNPYFDVIYDATIMLL